MEQKRRGGCGRIFLIFLVLMAVLVTAWVVVVHSGLLERIGLRQSAAERLFAPPPDREAAAALTDMLRQSGVDMQGVSVYVLPMAGREGSVALLTLDASQGLDVERFFGGDGGGVGEIFDPDTLDAHDITRLGFDYVDDRGKSIVTLTLPTEVLRSNEEMSEKEVLQAVMGRIDIPGLVREVTK